jgi:hypothetical protein
VGLDKGRADEASVEVDFTIARPVDVRRDRNNFTVNNTDIRAIAVELFSLS